ncbi:hypothetical protein HPP92_020073 [Vanilla planifolia]|uniref:C2H2-type domain-containing protein n=1 Tax=Vanilla planifolia TaxID=51239 RepID=A0A835Q594_VANPL|nr:hypothetical protein HPP92_020529 [Vanilla planifolia]KAG0465909.1 hypothetical protein HPP92_020073 [Vanilla planifolia]
MSGAEYPSGMSSRETQGSSQSSTWHVCSYCNKVYPNLQALGGHQTAHRKEIEEMRRQHDAQVHESRLQGGQSNSRSGSSRKAAIAAEGSSVDLELTLGTGESGLDLSLRL